MPAQSIQNILIIDDSVDYRQLLITFFKKACPAAHVEEYDPVSGRPPESFPWSRYDLLILDYNLGGGENGLEWLRQYKTSANFPPTIMLTAHDDEELVVSAIRYGAQSFLRKVGLTKNILIESINTALGKYAQEKEKAGEQKFRVHLYNKEMFFDSLGKLKKSDAIFLVEVDKYQSLYESIGIFGADKFGNFITDTITGCIKESGLRGDMTRIADSTVGLILNSDGNTSTITEFSKNLSGKFDHAEYKTDGGKLDFHVNIGAIFIDVDGKGVGELLARVESACREARDIEGNSYVIEETVAEELGEYEKELSKEVVLAIKQNRIRGLFQSLVLVSGTAHKDFRELYQVRSNILDAEKNVIEPKKFLPVLEKINALKKLDRWIIRYSVGELTDLQNKKPSQTGILIPISHQSINDKDLTDWVHRLIEHVKIPDLGKSLFFEVMAADFLNDSHQAKLQFNKLRIKLNASIALSGLTSLEILDKCLQQEKFDFIIFSPEHTGSEKMKMEQIQQIVKRAKEHKSLTVANKIDSGEYLALSASAGVDYVLGYFVQPPMENIVHTEEVVVVR